MVKTLVQGYIADKWQKQDWSLWKIGLRFKNTHVLTGEMYTCPSYCWGGGVGYVICFSLMVGGVYFITRCL